jgi:SNF2 family DNA or RNA helicase
LGQKNDVTVHTLVADHPSEQTALDRLKKKYALREMLLDPMETLDDTGIASYLSNSR